MLEAVAEAAVEVVCVPGDADWVGVEIDSEATAVCPVAGVVVAAAVAATPGTPSVVQAIETWDCRRSNAGPAVVQYFVQQLQFSENVNR